MREHIEYFRIIKYGAQHKGEYLDTEYKRGDNNKDDALEYWLDVEKALKSYNEAIGDNARFRPYYVLGVVASYTIMITLLSTLMSFYLSLITAYYTAQASMVGASSTSGPSYNSTFA